MYIHCPVPKIIALLISVPYWVLIMIIKFYFTKKKKNEEKGKLEVEI